MICEIFERFRTFSNEQNEKKKLIDNKEEKSLKPALYKNF